MKQKISIIIIIILVISQIFTFTKIKELNSKIDDLYNKNFNINNECISRNEISNIFMKLDDKLKEQESLIRKIEVTFGKLNTENLSVPVTYIVVPKNISDDTSLQLDFGDGKVFDMTKKGILFALTKEMSIFDEVNPNIIIKNDDISITETAEQNSYYNIIDEVFPNVEVSFDSSSMNPYTQCGQAQITKQENFSIEYTSAKLLCIKDGNVVKEKAVEFDSMGYANLKMIFDSELESILGFNKNTEAEMFIEMVLVDNLNLVHHFNCLNIKHDKKGYEKKQMIPYCKKSIYSEDGKLLWKNY